MEIGRRNSMQFQMRLLQQARTKKGCMRDGRRALQSNTHVADGK